MSRLLETSLSAFSSNRRFFAALHVARRRGNEYGEDNA